jgi:hypothetical protein
LVGNYGKSVTVNFAKRRNSGVSANFENALENIFGLSPPTTGVFFPNKISGVGTIFGLLFHVLSGPNKQRAFETRMPLS